MAASCLLSVIVLARGAPPSVSLHLEGHNQYMLTFEWQHNRSLAHPTRQVCKSEDKPSPFSELVILDDGVVDATGLRSVSVDWYPCGHPPSGFQSMHYDVHMYYVTEEQRNVMTCDSAGAVCSEDANPHFWVPMDDNIIDGFNRSTSAVKRSGMHYYHLDSPSLVTGSNPWVWPEPMVGSYNGTVSFFEVMVPLSFLSVAQSHTESVVYERRSDHHLPDSWSVISGTDDIVSVTIRGNRPGTLATAVSTHPNKLALVTTERNGQHELTMSWSHNTAWPLTTAELCNSEGKSSPVSDLTILDGTVTAATGLRSVSIDWYQCGNPPDGYRFMHYDIHMYCVTDRDAMTCSVAGGVCPRDANAVFWEPITCNAVAGFNMSTLGVKRTGMSGYTLEYPAASSENPWTLPEHYAGNSTFFQTMVPYTFEGAHAEIVHSLSRSDRHFPNDWSVTGDALKRTVITLSDVRMHQDSNRTTEEGSADKVVMSQNVSVEAADAANADTDSSSEHKHSAILAVVFIFLQSYA